MTFTAGLRVEEPRLRIAEPDALTALRAVSGQPVVAARARLRFGPGRTCEPLARLLDRAIVRAEAAGLDPASLIVADGSAAAAEDIVRVRRGTYGAADWIASPTCQVRIVLRPAGLHATAVADLPADLPRRPSHRTVPAAARRPCRRPPSPPSRQLDRPPFARRCPTSSTPTWA